MKTPLNILSISDIHLGNTRVDSVTIAERLNAYLVPLIPSADLLILGGDVFDTALSFDGTQIPIILGLFLDLMELCESHDVEVRFLRGTFSHERNQLANLMALYAHGPKKKGLCRYFDKVSLEYIEGLDLKVLYIPDDLPYPSSDVCIAYVKQMLEDVGWDSVDYAFVHGYFEHALPKGIPEGRGPAVCFTPEQFDFVKRRVLVGHVHTSSVKKHVLYNGSFDRLCHGEEEPKGFLSLKDFGDSIKITFVENKDATPFLTWDLTDITDPVDAVKAFNEKACALNPGVTHHIRVIHPIVEVRRAIAKVASSFANIVYTHKSGPTSDHEKIEKIKHDVSVIDLPLPTEEVLPSMVADFLVTKGFKNPLNQDRIRELLASL